MTTADAARAELESANERKAELENRLAELQGQISAAIAGRDTAVAAGDDAGALAACEEISRAQAQADALPGAIALLEKRIADLTGQVDRSDSEKRAARVAELARNRAATVRELAELLRNPKIRELHERTVSLFGEIVAIREVDGLSEWQRPAISAEPWDQPGVRGLGQLMPHLLYFLDGEAEKAAERLERNRRESVAAYEKGRRQEEEQQQERERARRAVEEAEKAAELQRREGALAAAVERDQRPGQSWLSSLPDRPYRGRGTL